jgi:hypothetical protein
LLLPLGEDEGVTAPAEIDEIALTPILEGMGCAISDIEVESVVVTITQVRESASYRLSSFF